MELYEDKTMSNELDPIEDQWYVHAKKGQRFYIVAVNEADGTIEVQHFDGDVEEYSIDDWCELEIELSEPPENWDGPMDFGDQDDLGTGITPGPQTFHQQRPLAHPRVSHRELHAASKQGNQLTVAHDTVLGALARVDHSAPQLADIG